jgi:hypothetical protein
MIFVVEVMLWRGEIMMEFAENGVGGNCSDTRIYVGTREQFNS